MQVTTKAKISLGFESVSFWTPFEGGWKDPDAGRDWGQEEKGTAEDEMAGWHQ